MTKFYVIYDSYTEYDQFSGDWAIKYKSFKTLKKCEEFINEIKLIDDYKDIIGPLIKYKS